MIKRYGRKFKNKSSVKRYVTRSFKTWDRFMGLVRDKRTKTICTMFKNHWERELRKLKEPFNPRKILE